MKARPVPIIVRCQNNYVLSIARVEPALIKTDFIEQYYPRLETKYGKSEEPEASNFALNQPEESVPGRVEERNWNLSKEAALILPESYSPSPFVTFLG